MHCKGTRTCMPDLSYGSMSLYIEVGYIWDRVIVDVKLWIWYSGTVLRVVTLLIVSKRDFSGAHSSPLEWRYHWGLLETRQIGGG